MSSELDKNYKTMHIDFAAYSGNAWYLSGWVVSDISVPSMSVFSDKNTQCVAVTAGDKVKLESVARHFCSDK